MPNAGTSRKAQEGVIPENNFYRSHVFLFVILLPVICNNAGTFFPAVLKRPKPGINILRDSAVLGNSSDDSAHEQCLFFKGTTVGVHYHIFFMISSIFLFHSSPLVPSSKMQYSGILLSYAADGHQQTRIFRL